MRGVSHSRDAQENAGVRRGRPRGRSGGRIAGLGVRFFRLPHPCGWSHGGAGQEDEVPSVAAHRRKTDAITADVLTSCDSGHSGKDDWEAAFKGRAIAGEANEAVPEELNLFSGYAP